MYLLICTLLVIAFIWALGYILEKRIDDVRDKVTNIEQKVEELDEKLIMKASKWIDNFMADAGYWDAYDRQENISDFVTEMTT